MRNFVWWYLPRFCRLWTVLSYQVVQHQSIQLKRGTCYISQSAKQRKTHRLTGKRHMTHRVGSWENLPETLVLTNLWGLLASYTSEGHHFNHIPGSQVHGSSRQHTRTVSRSNSMLGVLWSIQKCPWAISYQINHHDHVFYGATNLVINGWFYIVIDRWPWIKKTNWSLSIWHVETRWPRINQQLSIKQVWINH